MHCPLQMQYWSVRHQVEPYSLLLMNLCIGSRTEVVFELLVQVPADLCCRGYGYLLHHCDPYMGRDESTRRPLDLQFAVYDRTRGCAADNDLGVTWYL